MLRLKSSILAFYIGSAMSGVLRLPTSFLHKLAGIIFLLIIGSLGFIWLEKEEEMLVG